MGGKHGEVHGEVRESDKQDGDKVDFDELADIGIGHIGLSPNEFWYHLTFRDFNRKLNAYDMGEQKKWEKIRTLCLYMVQPHLQKNKTIKPEEIIHLPLIDKKQSKKVTPEEKERAKKLAEKWKNK